MNKRTSDRMKTLYILCAFILLVTCRVHDAEADFYVIAGAGGKPVGTEINALPYTISSPGFYFIAKDLFCVAGSIGITITADNVTLDLMGFSLVGPGGIGFHSGISMSGRTNVEIRNGTVRNFSYYGILENGIWGTGHRIINIRVNDNGNSGIRLTGRSHLIEQCTAVSNGLYGISIIDDSYGSTVTGNTCYDNTRDGILSIAGSTVTGNTCYGNGEDGISVGAGSTVTGNTCFGNTIYGIYAQSGSTVTGNTCYENGNNGIYTHGTGFTVTSNTCNNNGHHGIFADVGSTVIGNTCCNNTSQYGIYLNGNNFVDQNTAYGNGTNMNNACATCTFGKNHAP